MLLRGGCSAWLLALALVVGPVWPSVLAWEGEADWLLFDTEGFLLVALSVMVRCAFTSWSLLS